MSYEPILVIKKNDLEKHKTELDNWAELKEGILKEKIYKYLNEVLENKYNPKIDGIELLICQPELTSFNAAVRKVLYDWKIQFGTSY